MRTASATRATRATRASWTLAVGGVWTLATKPSLADTSDVVTPRSRTKRLDEALQIGKPRALSV